MTIKSDNVQIGQNATATQNFVLKQGADGTCTLARGNVGATTQDILTVANTTGLVSLTQGIANTGLPNLTVTSTPVTPLPGVGTAISYTHGLGVVPASVELEIVCLTAENGYSIGDVVTPFTSGNAGYGHPFSLTKTTTVVQTVTGSNYAWGIQNKTTGTVVAAPTAANWAYRFKVRTS